MSDDDFLAAFTACTLPRPVWTHEAHVRLARLLLLRHTLQETLDLIRPGIKRYNESLGNVTGYHDTVTVAYVHVIADRLSKAGEETWAFFRERNSDLFEGGLAVLARYYSEEVLNSAEAKLRFVEPDRESLPRREA